MEAIRDLLSTDENRTSLSCDANRSLNTSTACSLSLGILITISV